MGNQKASKINKKIIGLLKGLTDNNYVYIKRTKHIHVIGVYGGIERSFPLCGTPSTKYYQQLKNTQLKKFFNSLPIENNLSYPYF